MTTDGSPIERPLLPRQGTVNGVFKGGGAKGIAHAGGIDPALVAALNSDPDDWQRRGADQASAFETASGYGSSATFLAVAMLLAALAATGFSTVSAGRDRTVSEAASLLLLTCALTATAAGVGAAL